MTGTTPFRHAKMTKLSPQDLIKNLFSLLAFQYQTHALRYVRITEEFNTAKKIFNTGGALEKNNNVGFEVAANLPATSPEPFA